MPKEYTTIDDRFKMDPEESDPGEFKSYLRIISESETRAALMTDAAVRREYVELLRAVWRAVDDLDEVQAGLHPVDVTEKHLLCGNAKMIE